MMTVAVAVSIAAMLTAIFAFRFNAASRRLLLTGYFCLFLVLEYVAGYYFLPADALGIETAVVCASIAALFVGATRIRDRLEHSEEDEE
ncbi:MAG: hypothetical protein ACE5FL_01150 [Myxococcota bacterium]